MNLRTRLHIFVCITPILGRMTPLRRTLATLGIATIATAGSLFASGAPANAAYYNYGAIAHDNTTGWATWAVDYSDPNAAASNVMGRCGSHCGYFTFHNSCAAIAYTSDGSYWNRVSGYRTANDATGAALRGLPYRGYIATYACTTR